jgi:hypothetical protein
MAIEFPNTLHAAGLLQPVDPPAPLAPIVSARGLLAFDPNTTDSPDTFTGGFTRFAEGVYAVKFEDGIDFTEGVCWTNSVALLGSMAIAPQLPELVGDSLGDGRSAQLVFLDNDGKEADAVDGCVFSVTRYATRPLDVASLLLT